MFISGAAQNTDFSSSSSWASSPACQAHTPIPPTKTLFKASYPKVEHTSTFNKMLQLPLNILRTLRQPLHNYVGNFIVPGQTPNPALAPYLAQGRSQLLAQYQAKEVTLTTPDGVQLDAMHIMAMGNSKHQRTVICFNGNGEHYELHGLKQTIDLGLDIAPIITPMSNLEEFVAKGYNVLLFNYRGVGRSRGRPACPGLMLDGETAYQYVRKHCQVPKTQILLYGHSLGGGIATQIAFKHPGVNLCNARSFASLTNEIQHILTPLSAKLAKVAANLAYALGWEMDSLSVWPQIKGKKWMVYHPQDMVIQPTASLYQGVCRQLKQNVPVTQLKDGQGLCEHYELLMRAQVKRALTPAELSAIRTHALYADDPHNRPLLPAEMHEILRQFD